MSTSYQALFTNIPNAELHVRRPIRSDQRRIGFSSPAIDAMTDFRRVVPVVIRPDATIDDANRRMKEYGIRLLLITDSTGVLVGVTTANDVLGQKPLQIVQERGARHDEIMVRDIMMPTSAMEVIQMQDIIHAKVGNIISTMQRAQRQHALVVDVDNDGPGISVRGLFSAAQIARQLGINVPIDEIATNFADIKAQLNHGAERFHPLH